MRLLNLASLNRLQLSALGDKFSGALFAPAKQLLLIEPGKKKDEWIAWLWIKPAADKSQKPQSTQQPPQEMDWELAQSEPISQFIGNDLGQWQDLPPAPLLLQALPSQEFISNIIQLKRDESEYWSELILAQASEQQLNFNPQNFHAEELSLPASGSQGYFTTNYLLDQQTSAFPKVKQLSQAYIDNCLHLRRPPTQASLALLLEQGQLILALGMAGQWISWTPLTTQLDSSALIQQAKQEIALLKATLQMQGLDWQAELFIEDDMTSLTTEEVSSIKVVITELKQLYQCSNTVQTAKTAQTVKLPKLPTLPTTYPSYQSAPMQVFLARQKQKKILKYASLATLAACFCLLLGVGINVLYLKAKLKQTAQQITIITKQVAPIMQHLDEWDSLAPIVDSEQWTLEILLACYRNASIDGLKLSQIQVQQGAIKIEGQAQSLKIANQFNLRISKNQFFDSYQWQLPPAKQDSQGNWSFSYQAYIDTSDTL